MKKDEIDYSLYLVTDSTPAILGDKDICEVVEAALRGGVTCVQYRDKTSDTGVLAQTARKLHAITQKYNIPLLINDRVDVALAVGCEGVHIGQDDLDIESARKLLGHDKIIGVTVSNASETAAACEDGADYLGIGTVFATPTKENTKSIIGVDGLQQILLQLAQANSTVKTVCIGGINASNTSRVVWQSRVPGKGLDGVAVVSAIVAAADPEASARELSQLVKALPAFVVTEGLQDRFPEELVKLAPQVIQAVAQRKPLSHNMTNLVVQNFAANVALCVGASPIMANYGEEAKDLSKLGGALVINMGTVTPEGLENYLKALKAYNAAGGPVVFDPVGAGATAVRRAATKKILGDGYIDVIKGNRSEILSCLPGGSTVQQRGVDSADGDIDITELASALKELAALRKNIVVITGKTDYVTDGAHVYKIENGHEYLGMVTGTGCCLGTTISAMIAAWPQDKLAATVAGLLHYNIAAELAAEREDVKGPGSFVPAFLDELYKVRAATSKEDLGWLARAKVASPLCASPRPEAIIHHGGALETASVCDLQDKFRNAIWQFDKILLTSQKVLRAAQILQIPIVVTTQNAGKLGPIVPELQPLIKDAAVHSDKTLFSMVTPEVSSHALFTSPNKREVVIVGIESHICVTQTALDMLAQGHKVYILADGVSSCNEEEIPVALARLRAEGAVVTTSESWIYETMGDAGIAEFRDIAKLVKETSADTKTALSGLLSKI
ncbi:Hydroxyethylthiazole kinase family-domain-containing protein [Xylaria cubensis]|nr:Hydroxyethylthiazole kinase family-domain-containing protein [Xylaria cubensis]